MDGPKLKSLLLIVPMACLALVASCSPAPDSEESTEEDKNWPTGLVAPIRGATFSMIESHLPGAAAENRPGAKQGFDFLNGFSGRPFAEDEPVTAIAKGDVVRIDHNYQDLESDTLEFWTDQAAAPGALGEHAQDKLRGRQIWLRHPDNHISRYAHLSMAHPELQLGDAVEQGQPIGLIGNSGLLPSEEQPNPPPRLHFELWASDGTAYFGQGLSPLEIHQQVAATFGADALPRYARAVIELANSGQATPEPYLPENLPETGFSMDPPQFVTVGEAFAAPISWEADEFRADGFYADLGGLSLGVIDVGPNTYSAWILGAMPIDAAELEQVLTISGSDQFGRTLTGQSEISPRRRNDIPDPREVEPAYFEKHNNENLQLEANRVIHAAVQSLNVVEPHWNKPFQPPLEGEVVTPFAQRIYHGILRPAHPYPGAEIQPDEPGAAVLASNNGEVILVEDFPIRGKTVAIAHGGGVVTLYTQLDSITVSVGDQVSQGGKLGTAGEDPEQDSSIRWEIHVAGIPTNPLTWIGKVLPGQ